MTAPKPLLKRKYIVTNPNPGWFKKTHGSIKHPLYKVWSGMLTRCRNKNSHAYNQYGGRGITICRSWKKFENFLEDMGPRPKGTCLDRIDNNGNYSPSNCRWADQNTQQNNRSNNVRITYLGRTMTSIQWAREMGLSKTTLCYRLQSNWPIEDAINAKPDTRNRYGR